MGTAKASAPTKFDPGLAAVYIDYAASFIADNDDRGGQHHAEALADISMQLRDMARQSAARDRLAAAAPDLLAACREITRVLDALGWTNVASDWPVVTDACELARAAIAKAEGR